MVPETGECTSSSEKLLGVLIREWVTPASTTISLKRWGVCILPVHTCAGFAAIDEECHRSNFIGMPTIRDTIK
jgi:hypothetical protein